MRLNRIIYLLIATMTVATIGRSDTVAHWDFNYTTNNPDHPAGAGNLMPGNALRNDVSGDGVTNSLDYRMSSIDLSGNNNHLCSWAYGVNMWSADSKQGGGDLSMVDNPDDDTNRGARTDNTYNPYALGINAEDITPAAWTVEAVFKAFDLTGNQTIVGRDGNNTDSSAALYLTTRGTDLAIAYTDIDGGLHNLQVAAGLLSNTWYTAAAASDGTTLSLYLDGSLIGTPLDLTETSTDTALQQGFGTWTVGEGMWGGSAADVFSGAIDEVAISNAALGPGTFVIPEPATIGLIFLAGISSLLIRRFFR